MPVVFPAFTNVWHTFWVGGYRNKVEEPLTIEKEYSVQWRESRVNLSELAKLRWIDGWTNQKLANHFNKTLFAIKKYCYLIRKLDCDLLELTFEEKEKIKWALRN